MIRDHLELGQRLHLRLPWPRTRLATMGPDGFAMLVLANMAILATGGISFLLSLRRVWTVARTAPARSDHDGCRLVLGVCLGCRGLPADFMTRLERARILGGTQPILILGGRTTPGREAEAAAGRDWLMTHGIASDRIRLEDASRNTLENLRMARTRLAAAGGGRPVLISNRYHLARVGLLATGLGMPHDLCAAEDRLRPDARTILRLILEAYFVNWYWSGRLCARMLRHHGMLERIT